MSESNSLATPLNVNTLPLAGIHLIEASAGTGKTFNITRIYLRLLLESELSVTQILVMTFTNAATQELRGRLTETLHQATLYWQSEQYRNANPDPVFDALYDRVCPERSISLLSLALVEMDEAAIYTLHGFCQRILKQMAFSTGNALQVTLQNDQQKALQRSINDWFRMLREQPEKLTLLAQSNWHTPDAFIRNFESLIYSAQPPQVIDAETIESDHLEQLDVLTTAFAPDFEKHLNSLTLNQTIVYEKQVASEKDSAKRNQREVEWRQLLDWLKGGCVSDIPEGIKAFLNGNCYKAKDKGEVKLILKPIAEMYKEVVSEVKKLVGRTEKRRQELPLLELVAEGLEFIKLRITSEKSQRSEVSFDDLIQLLADAVSTDNGTATQLLQAFPAALVDEFQDTDALQYRILSKVYVEHANNLNIKAKQTPLLVMIGDPKQAIYGFRGGDIFTYLRARNSADCVWYMDTNWRSTAQMVQAYNRVFWGNSLDQANHPVFGYGIHYEQVKSTPSSAAAKRPLQALDTTESRAALTYFVADSDAIRDAESKQQKPMQQAQLSHWCVAEIKRLRSSCKLDEDRVQPADIAILVRNRIEAQRIGDYLRNEGLTAVYLSDKTPIFSSIQAHELLLVLTGIWHCENDSDLVRALSSSLLGAEPSSLAKMQQDPLAKDWSVLRKRVYDFRQMWSAQGVMPLLLSLLKTYYRPTFDGERSLTNYLHLTELLEQASRQHSHPLQILQWLRQKTEHLEADEQHEQRLESDAGLIKIVTQHKSKGLEYPFVFVPYVNEYRDPTMQNNSIRRIFRYFEPTTESQVWQLGQCQRSIELLREQEHAESIRLLYVAITRAEYQCYLGIGEYPNSEKSSIGLALGKAESGEGMHWYEFLNALSEFKDNHCAVKLASEILSLETEVSSEALPPNLIAKTLHRNFEQKWRVHSFSALTRFNEHGSWTEREKEATLTDSQEIESNSNDIRFSFPKGAIPGNFIHDVFEHTDFSKPEWQTHCETLNTRYALVESDQMLRLANWFDAVIDTPIGLGPQQSSAIRLRQLPLMQTLREAEFYFPITSLDSQHLLSLLHQHRQRLSEQGLLSKEHLELPLQLGRSSIEGMMHGFIDLIFEHNGKFYVADYKSTHLGTSLKAYQPTALAENNLKHAYDLQYLIYAVALHRYLKQQLPDYQPEVHFGGVCYLYVRGMSPMDSNGVFFTPIGTELLLALDAVFSIQTGNSEE